MPAGGPLGQLDLPPEHRSRVIQYEALWSLLPVIALGLGCFAHGVKYWNACGFLLGQVMWALIHPWPITLTCAAACYVTGFRRLQIVLCPMMAVPFSAGLLSLTLAVYWALSVGHLAGAYPLMVFRAIFYLSLLASIRVVSVANGDRAFLMAVLILGLWFSLQCSLVSSLAVHCGQLHPGGHWGTFDGEGYGCFHDGPPEAP